MVYASGHAAGSIAKHMLPDVSRITQCMSAQAVWDEAIRMLCWQNVGTFSTHARDTSSRFPANWTYHASRIETKHVKNVPEIESGGLHFDGRLVGGQGLSWRLLRSNGEIEDGPSLCEAYLAGSCICY